MITPVAVEAVGEHVLADRLDVSVGVELLAVLEIDDGARGHVVELDLYPAGDGASEVGDQRSLAAAEPAAHRELVDDPDRFVLLLDEPPGRWVGELDRRPGRGVEAGAVPAGLLVPGVVGLALVVGVEAGGSGRPGPALVGDDAGDHGAVRAVQLQLDEGPTQRPPRGALPAPDVRRGHRVEAPTELQAQDGRAGLEQHVVAAEDHRLVVRGQARLQPGIGHRPAVEGGAVQAEAGDVQPAAGDADGNRELAA